MELRHLKYFVAVAEELNFRRAAEVVHVAQPSLSQQIKQLEDELGVALFVRSHHKVTLTVAGKTFYASAQMILREARQAVADARAVEHGEAGRLTLGFVSSAAISVLPSLLAFVRSQLPQAEVELKELAPGEQIDALYHGKLDLGLFHAELKDAAFETAVVSRERLIVALPSASRFARNKQIDLREVAGETVIIPARHATPGYFEHARSAFQAAGVMPERIYHTGLLQTGVLLVGAGLGISLVPESFQRVKVQGVVYRPLATAFPTSDLPKIDLIAAWRRDNTSPLLARIAKEIRERSAALLTTG
jgi:DNA-binding transcriptional LysR family regulator